MKMVIGGSRCGPPKEAKQPDLLIGDSVKKVRHGVVLNSGLLGVITDGGILRLPRIKTIFGGNLWVIRSLTPVELLSCWDVPEKLGQLLETEREKLEVMKEVFTPLKIRQSVLEDVRTLMPQLLKNQSNEKEQEKGWYCGERRGARLAITSPEEEKAIFQDKSELPFNDLIEKVERLDLSKGGSDQKSVKVEKGPSGAATKDDKAPIKSEYWDKYLFLGLSEHAKAGSWARAARTIRPLVASHWRRLQMRKWIRFVRDKHKRL
jgi:hypothetical protein